MAGLDKASPASAPSSGRLIISLLRWRSFRWGRVSPKAGELAQRGLALAGAQGAKSAGNPGLPGGAQGGSDEGQRNRLAAAVGLARDIEINPSPRLTAAAPAGADRNANRLRHISH